MAGRWAASRVVLRAASWVGCWASTKALRSGWRVARSAARLAVGWGRWRAEQTAVRRVVRSAVLRAQRWAVRWVERWEASSVVRTDDLTDEASAGWWAG